ncbi:hypothetical protein SAMN05444161_3139 [Rhizobiales bacterium GAS191]|nr:hypothetical protein SAMN05444161_3139 [Rhizobiales bacterium GAS191]
MDQKFARLVERLHPSFLKLKDCPPLSAPKDMPKQGIYLFTENGRDLYVGRSNAIPDRYSAHRRLSSGENTAAFAFILACETVGRGKAAYKKEGSRKSLMERSRVSEGI